MNNNKTALVVVGGAFRSTYYSGSLKALKELGLENAFDLYVGISAGAPAVAFSLTDQYEDMCLIWKDYISTKKIYNPKNIFSSGPIVNLDYLIDEVFSNIVPLNFEKLNEKNFLIPLMNYENGEIKYFYPNHKDFKNILKACMSIPWLTKKTYTIEGENMIDAGIAENLILKKLVEDGYSKILLLMGHTGIHDLPNWRETIIEKLFFLSNPAVGKVAKKLLIANIEERLNLFNNKNYEIVTISPKKYHVAKFENSSKKLVKNIEQGYEDIMSNTELKEKLLKTFSK